MHIVMTKTSPVYDCTYGKVAFMYITGRYTAQPLHSLSVKHQQPTLLTAAATHTTQPRGSNTRRAPAERAREIDAIQADAALVKSAPATDADAAAA